jgi:hypothetical protein
METGNSTIQKKESLTNTVESAALVVQMLSTLSDTLFTSTKSTEVFGGFGSLAKETHDNAATFATFDFDVEEDLVFDCLATVEEAEVVVIN